MGRSTLPMTQIHTAEEGKETPPERRPYTAPLFPAAWDTPRERGCVGPALSCHSGAARPENHTKATAAQRPSIKPGPVEATPGRTASVSPHTRVPRSSRRPRRLSRRTPSPEAADREAVSEAAKPDPGSPSERRHRPRSSRAAALTRCAFSHTWFSLTTRNSPLSRRLAPAAAKPSLASREYLLAWTPAARRSAAPRAARPRGAAMSRWAENYKSRDAVRLPALRSPGGRSLRCGLRALLGEGKGCLCRKTG